MNVTGSGLISTQNVSATKQTETQNVLGKDAFMKILITQMKNQDPLEPLKDTEFIAQMAQFSSLEQLTNLNQNMTQFIGLQGKQTLTEHADLLGNIVYWEQEIDGELQSGEGIVKAMVLNNGDLMVELGNGELTIPIANIHRIEMNTETKN